MSVSPSTGIVQKVDLAISATRFGNRYNVVYATAGLGTPDAADSRWGYKTIDSTGAENKANISCTNYNYRKPPESPLL